MNQKEIAVRNRWNFIILKPTRTHSNQQAGGSSTEGAGSWRFRFHVSDIFFVPLPPRVILLYLSKLFFFFFEKFFGFRVRYFFPLRSHRFSYASCDSLLSSDKRVGQLRFYDASHISKNKIFSTAHMVAKHIERVCK